MLALHTAFVQLPWPHFQTNDCPPKPFSIEILELPLLRSLSLWLLTCQTPANLVCSPSRTRPTRPLPVSTATPPADATSRLCHFGSLCLVSQLSLVPCRVLRREDTATFIKRKSRRVTPRLKSLRRRLRAFRRKLTFSSERKRREGRRFA